MLFKKLLEKAHQLGASDVHLSSGKPPLFRIHGELKTTEGPVITEDMLADALRLALNSEAQEAFRRDGEADTAFELEGICRWRINAFKQRGQTAMACRRIPLSPPSLDQLRLPDILGQLAMRNQGLVLVTGPTGCGKSTTLAAMIHHINTHQARHIVTLEDPIEYIHQSRQSLIHQREVGSDTASFAQGLRAALRQDPDVILLGEMRDLETIRTALTAAETGHLVLATLHTPNAPQSIDRIVDVFPPGQQEYIRLQLAGVLAAVIAQRLLPSADGQKRVACFEILLNTPAVANLIRSGKVHQIRSVMETGRQQGMQTMEQAVQELVAQGRVKKEVADQLIGDVH